MQCSRRTRGIFARNGASQARRFLCGWREPRGELQPTPSTPWAGILAVPTHCPTIREAAWTGGSMAMGACEKPSSLQWVSSPPVGPPNPPIHLMRPSWRVHNPPGATDAPHPPFYTTRNRGHEERGMAFRNFSSILSRGGGQHPSLLLSRSSTHAGRRGAQLAAASYQPTQRLASTTSSTSSSSAATRTSRSEWALLGAAMVVGYVLMPSFHPPTHPLDATHPPTHPPTHPHLYRYVASSSSGNPTTASPDEKAKKKEQVHELLVRPHPPTHPFLLPTHPPFPPPNPPTHPFLLPPTHPPSPPQEKIRRVESQTRRVPPPRPSVDVVLGSQWGDEGKGKLVDILSQKYDVVARVAGGSNAGR